MRKLLNLLNLFYGRKEVDYLADMENLLISEGFTREFVPKKNGTNTTWFHKEGVDNVIAFAENHKGVRLSLIIPREFAFATYARNGKFESTICIQKHSTNGVVAKYRSDRLHRQIYKFYGGVLPDGLQIDHICGHEGVVVFCELRPCTDRENKFNKPGRKSYEGAGEFAYDPFHDFRDCFWIPFLYYGLDIISKDDMKTLKQMIFDRDKGII